MVLIGEMEAAGAGGRAAGIPAALVDLTGINPILTRLVAGQANGRPIRLAARLSPFRHDSPLFATYSPQIPKNIFVMQIAVCECFYPINGKETI